MSLYVYRDHRCVGSCMMLALHAAGTRHVITVASCMTPCLCMSRDTARLLLKVLTVRATQKVLMQLQELDLHVAGWLSDFCSSHPPAKGDEVRRGTSFCLGHVVVCQLFNDATVLELMDAFLFFAQFLLELMKMGCESFCAMQCDHSALQT